MRERSRFSTHFFLLAGYCLISFLIAGLRADIFFLGSSDTALTLNSLWRAAHFLPLQSAAGVYEVRYFAGTHVIPAGFLLAQIYRFFPVIYTAVFFHVVSFSAAGYFVYRIFFVASRSELFSCLFLGLFLFCYTPIPLNFYPEDWGAGFVAAALWFFLDARYKISFLCWVGAMMFKEPISTAVAAWGLSGFIFKHPFSTEIKSRAFYQYSLACFLGGAIWFSAAYFFIMPFFESQWAALRLLTGGNAADKTELAFLVFTHPGHFFSRLFSAECGFYLFKMLAPMAFFPLGAVSSLFALLPVLLINSQYPFIFQNAPLNSHYFSVFQPMIFFAGAAAFFKLKNQNLRRILSGIVVIFLILGLKQWFFYLKDGFRLKLESVEYVREVKEILPRIPGTASVSAEETLMPFLANRKEIVHPDLADKYQPQYRVSFLKETKSLPGLCDHSNYFPVWRGSVLLLCEKRS